ncbi:MAG: CIA30 family protein [Pseudomonadota bacterium]
MGIRATIATMIASSLVAMATAQEGTTMSMDFSDQAVAAQWQAVNDGVMGGKSSGGPAWSGDHMTFSGIINTDGGGFSSIRAPMAPGSLADASTLKLRVKTDGRAFRLMFRTNVKRWGMRVSFQAPIPAGSPGEWTDVEIPLTGLESSFHGRPVDADFDKSDVRSIGIIIADGQDGPFEMSIASIDKVLTRQAAS